MITQLVKIAPIENSSAIVGSAIVTEVSMKGKINETVVAMSRVAVLGEPKFMLF